MQAVVEAATDATGAACGWLLALEGDHLVVEAAYGTANDAALIGRHVPIAGTRGYVVTSNQPAALRPNPADQADLGAGGYDGVPSSIVAVPCTGDLASGVLEIAAPLSDTGFGIDDVEIVGLLASIAAAALDDARAAGAKAAASATPPPAAMGLLFERLSASDPALYRDLAAMVSSLIAHLPPR